MTRRRSYSIPFPPFNLRRNRRQFEASEEKLLSPPNKKEKCRRIATVRLSVEDIVAKAGNKSTRG